MTHEQLKVALKTHHLASAARDGEIASLHKAASRHLEVSDPNLSEVHAKLAQCHKAASDHHARFAAQIDDVTEERDVGAEVARLHRTLSGA